MNNQELSKNLEEKAKKLLDVYNGAYDENIKPKNDTSSLWFHMQTPLRLTTDCQFFVMGINPGDCLGDDEPKNLLWRDKQRTDLEHLLAGNPCFEGKDVIEELKTGIGMNGKATGWNIYHKIKRMLGYGGKAELMEDIKNFTIQNIFLWGTLKAKDIDENYVTKIQAELALDLVPCLSPKVLLLVGKNRDTKVETPHKWFCEVTKEEFLPLVNGSIDYCFWNGTHVLSIKHTTFPYTEEEMKLIGKVLCYALEHPQQLDRTLIENLFGQEIRQYVKRVGRQTMKIVTKDISESLREFVDSRTQIITDGKGNATSFIFALDDVLALRVTLQSSEKSLGLRFAKRTGVAEAGDLDHWVNVMSSVIKSVYPEVDESQIETYQNEKNISADGKVIYISRIKLCELGEDSAAIASNVKSVVEEILGIRELGI